jgi:hypothetical protein
LCARSQ